MVCRLSGAARGACKLNVAAIMETRGRRLPPIRTALGDWWVTVEAPAPHGVPVTPGCAALPDGVALDFEAVSVAYVEHMLPVWWQNAKDGVGPGFVFLHVVPPAAPLHAVRDYPTRYHVPRGYWRAMSGPRGIDWHCAVSGRSEQPKIASPIFILMGFDNPVLLKSTDRIWRAAKRAGAAPRLWQSMRDAAERSDNFNNWMDVNADVLD